MEIMIILCKFTCDLNNRAIQLHGRVCLELINSSILCCVPSKVCLSQTKLFNLTTTTTTGSQCFAAAAVDAENSINIEYQNDKSKLAQTKWKFIII